MRKQKKSKKIIFKFILFFLAIAVALIVSTSEIFKFYILQLAPIVIIAELVAGGLYTSIITVPISVSLFSVLVQESSIGLIIFVGAIGATIGDYIIMNVFHKASKRVRIKSKRWMRLRKSKRAKVALKTLGLLCLALPVPDEVAMSILGISRIRLKHFILLVYPAKAFGIFLVVVSLQAI